MLPDFLTPLVVQRNNIVLRDTYCVVIGISLHTCKLSYLSYHSFGFESWPSETKKEGNPIQNHYLIYATSVPMSSINHFLQF